MEDVQFKDMIDVTEMHSLNANQIIAIILNSLCAIIFVQLMLAKNVIMI
jgi:hypothetical protein